jgi:hypothetical protein
MNFYQYYQPGDTLEENPVKLAAKDIIAHGMQVIPLTKGSKKPANIKSVYELLSHPINDKNFDYYFSAREIDLGIILQDDMEFIDIDEKNKPGITQSVLKAIEYGWPEIYEALTIDFTPSGGCHLIYRSEVIGGKQSLAKVPASPNPLTTIERISKSNKQYIKISPSEGYSLKQGNPLDLKFLTSEQRNWLSALAESFNELHTPEVKRKEAEREDSPWSVFNKQNDWKYIRNELIDRHWTIVMELTDKVVVKRPGKSDQRSSGVIYKDKSWLYLYTTSSEFEDGKPYSPFGVYCLFYHDGNIGMACKQLASQGIGKNISEEGQFWIRNKTKIKIKYTELLNWLHSIGYRVYDKTIVQVINNTVEIADEVAMKRAFISEVEFEMQDEMFERVGTIFSNEGGLIAMLTPLDDNFIRDDKDSIWLFFRNLAIKISSLGCEPFDYKHLTGYIWKSSIISRDFYETSFEGCDADKFSDILANGKKQDLQEILGYSISQYKDPLNPRAVIIMEDIDANEEGESQGGSGKGLLFQFVEQFRKPCYFDGKNFKTSDQFIFQNVEQDTAILFIDDVEKQFRFNSLFSILTGGLMINKKNKPQTIIPFSRSPKIFITSNYSIGGMDISSNRRKYEFAISKYFGEDVEPIDVFKREFFTGWDKTEWLRFDNFMVDCCVKYLGELNKKNIGNITANSSERSLISNTNREFVDYMDGQESVNFFDFAPLHLKTKTIHYPDGSMTTNGVSVEAYIHSPNIPDNYFTIAKTALFDKLKDRVKSKYFSISKLSQWLNRWADARGAEIDVSYKRIADSERIYRIIAWKYNFFNSDTAKNPSRDDSESGLKLWQANPEWDDK